MLVLVVVTLLVGAILVFALMKLKKSNEENKKFKERYSDLINEDEALDQKRKELSEISTSVKDEKNKSLKLLEVKKRLEENIKELEENSELQEFGLYKPKYFYETSNEYKEKLDEIYEKQKQMIKGKTAAICPTEWTVSGSKVEGRKMTNDNIKLILRAFNGEADAAIARVKYNNITIMENRIVKSIDAINKLSVTNHCHITEEYYKLKMHELYLNYEYANKAQEEKEEQRMIKEQMREEEKARKEYEKAIKDAEMEELRNQRALEKARKEYEVIMLTKSEEEREKYAEQIAELERRLEEAHQLKERATSQAQLTRSGHVYVISNVGSFGENIYKIGMTRRLDPLDRVKELGDASVPFPFDVHAMIYSEDAPGLESRLHKEFIGDSVNLVNMRKEFFNVDLDRVESFVREQHGDFQLTKLAEAEQYRQTLAMKDKHIEPTFNPEEEFLASINEELEDLEKLS